MIDNFSILVSLIAIAYVLLAAIRLDRTRPWFRSEDGPEKAGR